MAWLTFLLLAICAGAFVEGVPSKIGKAGKDDTIPAYLLHLTKSKQALDTVKRLAQATSKQPVTDTNRNYVILASVVLNVANQLTALCPGSYEEIYLPAVEKLVPDAWQHPEAVYKSFADIKQRVDEQIEPIKTLIEKLCNANPSGAPVNCDQQVHAEVQKDPKKYEHSIQLLKAAGKASSVFIKDTYETTARMHQVIDLLVSDGQKKLKELIVKTSYIIKIIYNRLSSC